MSILHGHWASSMFAPNGFICACVNGLWDRFVPFIDYVAVMVVEKIEVSRRALQTHCRCGLQVLANNRPQMGGRPVLQT